MTTKHRIGFFFMGLSFWTLAAMTVGMVWVGEDQSLDANNFFGIGFLGIIGLSVTLWTVLAERE